MKSPENPSPAKTVHLPADLANRIVHALTASLFYLRDNDPELEKQVFDLAVLLRIAIDTPEELGG